MVAQTRAMNLAILASGVVVAHVGQAVKALVGELVHLVVLDLVWAVARELA